MINLEDELAQQYLVDCREHLDNLEMELSAIEATGAGFDDEPVARAFQSLHSVKEGAVLFGLAKIRELAHQTEDALAMIRSRKVVLTSYGVSIMLAATDKLRELIQNPAASQSIDLAGIMADLERLNAAPNSEIEKARLRGGHLRILLVEDDFVSRLLLQSFLGRYGECHVAINGRESVESFRYASERGHRYDLICMDIMMPEMDGREAVRQIRGMEKSNGILSTFGAKIIMTTTVDDIKQVSECFQNLCDAYLKKPIDLAELLSQMKSYRLVP